jgi:predicted ATPase/signal transduction histidine kinase
MIDLSKHRFEALGHDDEYLLYRARGEEDGSQFLVLAPAVKYHRADVLKRLEHEHALREELDREWAVRPIALNRRGGQPVLVLEDPSSAAVMLDGCLKRAANASSGEAGGQPMEVNRFLRLAINLAVALGKLHARGLIHKDIKPVHILVDSATERVWFTGFGISSRFARERQPAQAPEVIAGTLPYMAPEQTGRMNRSIDSRSDLYSLGVTFYQMLTGALPFTASEPMDWVHCHLARQPVSPSELRPHIPELVSAIVLKLLSKTAEERYQTAAGLEADLRRASADWESRRQIDAFPLGASDIPDQLRIPERLYGREREVASLRAAFDRVVAGGGPELVLVTGQAGVGKSAVVHELHRAGPETLGSVRHASAATDAGDQFASGKSDQYNRDIPYASLAQAVLDLIRPLLARSEAELASWRAAITAALGLNGALMVALLPDLEHLIGPQPPVPELPARDAQRRFQLVFRRLLGVFARAEHPLALFLDDLQWLDAATLDLIEDLLTQPDLQHLLLIGAYRNDEVTSTHPLARRMAAIRKAGGRVQVIALKPLGLEIVSRIVADALHCPDAAPLARLVHEKTAGNPFFASQFLVALAEEGLLSFNAEETRWTWDLKRIRAKGFTDNVVDLVLGKLRRLPVATQAALKRLASLGDSAPIATLALVQGENEDALNATLATAIRAGLLLRHEGDYKFLHDRVREAAYALIPEAERAAAHLTIGRHLAAHTTPGALEESIFEIIGHLNRGATLISSSKERGQLAELNLIAGRRAKASGAYSSALTYFTTGETLLPKDAWKRRHDLAFTLEMERAECEFLTGALPEAEMRLAKLSDRAASPSELATLTRLQVDLFMMLSQNDRAVAVGLDCLRRFGVNWSAHPTKNEVQEEYARLRGKLADRPIERLLDLPHMVDPVACASMDVIASLVTPALWTDENLRRLVIGRMGNLSLEHGNSDASGYAYTAVGNVLGLYFGDYKAGFRFGQLGLDFVEQAGMDRWKPRVYLAFGNLAKPSVRHFRSGQPLARYAFETAQRVGDLTYAAISCNNLITQLLASGAPLVEVHQEAEAGLEFARRARFGVVVSLITAQLALIRTLRGLTPVFGCFNGDDFDEEEFERQLSTEPSLGTTPLMYWIRKLQARILADDRVGAAAAATKAEHLLWMTPVIFERADYHLHAALTLIAIGEAATDVESAKHKKCLIAHHRQLQAWAEHCPENFTSRAALVGAEIARLSGRELDAEHLYQQAIRSARSNGLFHNEAIAYERGAAFYRARGFDEIAALYLQNARQCYLRWGADGKVRQLDEIHPNLRTGGADDAAMGGIATRIDQLDLTTVVTVSQTVSSEIQFEKLIETLLKLAIEHAGAERGLLVLAQGEQYRIEAEIKTALDQVHVQLRHAPVTSSELPESLFRYVIRTHQKIILDDASANNMFSEDQYLQQRRPRSILCLPLVKQTKMIGAVYLENNLAPRVFTQKRLAMLELLASQAAISLDHARIHAELAQENIERKRTEEELRRSEAFLAQGQRISRTGSWRWHVSTGAVYWSEERFRIFGYDPHIDKPSFSLLFERVHEQDKGPFKDALNRAVQDRSDFEFEYRIVLPDGSIKFLWSVGQPRLNSAGELEYIGTTMDITERKRAEEAWQKAQSELAHVNRVATLGQLAASITHEINQPLGAIANNAGAGLRFLASGSENLEDVKAALSDILKGADRVNRIIARMRALAKKVPPEITQLNFTDLVSDVLALIQHELTRRQVEIELEISVELPPVLAERVQLQQVLLNLVMNGVEAMNDKDRDRKIWIRAQPYEYNGSSAVLVGVQDSGSGLSQAEVNRLFEPFYTTKAQGLGMGLAICRSIIEAHSGRLWLVSGAGPGATFQFVLPAKG